MALDRWSRVALALLLPCGLACARAGEPAPGDDAAGGEPGEGGRRTGQGGKGEAGKGGAPGGEGGAALVDAAIPGLDMSEGGASGEPDAAPDLARDLGGAGGMPGGGLCTEGGDCTAVIGKLDGWLVDESCKGPRTGADCAGAWCDGKRPALDTTFRLMGAAADPGKTFLVTLVVRGVSECKQYQGGRRRVAAQKPAGMSQDMWYVGGMPEGLPGTPWNIHGLHVRPKPAGEPADYYLNACGAGQAETH